MDISSQAPVQAFAEHLHTCWTPWSALKKKQELWARPPVLTPVPLRAIHSRACLNSHHSDIQGTAQKSPYVNTFRGHRQKEKKEGFFTVWVPGTPCQDTQTRVRARTHETTDTRDNRETLRYDGGCGNFLEALTWSSAVHQAQCDAPLQVGHRRCRRRSWRHVNQQRFRRVWHGVIFVVRRLCHGPFHGLFGSGLRLDVLREELIVGVECRGFRHGIAAIAVAVGTQATPTARPHTVLVAEVRDCASRPFGRRLAPPRLVHDQAFEGAIEDGAGKNGARLRLSAALEAAEDGHVAGLQVRRASWREEAQHDVRERRPHGLAGVDAGHVPEKDPRLSFSARVQHSVAVSCRSRRRGPAIL